MRRPLQTFLTILAVALLVSFAVPAVDAHVPRARHYRVGHAITLDTNLLSTSGASAWAINDYLLATTSLPPLGKAFIAAEARYGVNARFLLAAAMHESAWGTSYIARRKHNLFGYNAFDRDPSRYASAYATYAANIDATARFIKDFYLTPGGRWWGGAPTLRSMQRFWSSSHQWGIGVSRIASSIHLHTLAGSALEFTAPSVSGGLHGGDQASVQLKWAGGTIPAGVEFVAQFVPVALDADAVTDVPSTAANAEAGAVDGSEAPPRSFQRAPAPHPELAQWRVPSRLPSRRHPSPAVTCCKWICATREVGTFRLRSESASHASRSGSGVTERSVSMSSRASTARGRSSGSRTPGVSRSPLSRVAARPAWAAPIQSCRWSP